MQNVSLRDNLHEMIKPNLEKKNRKPIINLSSAKFSHKAVKVKIIFLVLQLTIKDSGTPKVTVICISCIANGNYKVCGSKSVAIQGTCSSNCDDTTKYAWFVTTATGAIVSIDSTQTSTGMNKPNLVLKGIFSIIDNLDLRI